ncbi:hypothetical protein MBLNU230_g5592t1 [Neophaeotheca triangularis]
MSEQLGTLTKCGLLYEGNFEEMKESLNHLFKALSKSSTFCDIGEPRRISMFSSSPSVDSNLLDLGILKAKIAPSLLARMPNEARKRRKSLMEWLAKNAQPFPLMDLPPEVRLRIFSEVLRNTRPEINFDVKGGLREVSSTPLVQASSQIRRELLPLYYQHLCPGITDAWCGEAVVEVIRDFVAFIGTHHIRYVRRFSVKFGASGPQSPCWPGCWCIGEECDDTVLVDFQFHPLKGLTVNVSRALAAASKAKLSKHVRRVETMRLAAGLQGECLAMAIAGDPSLWDEGILKLEGY